jgi:hypothetical protein
VLPGNPIVLLLWAAIPVSLPLAAAAAETGRSLAEDLRALGEKRVFFGHQSVGFDLLDGLRDLALEAGIPLRIVEGEFPRALATPGIVHATLGENARPSTKIDAFAAAMGEDGADRATIAFFKFCYVDFDAGTDVPALFDRYASALERLRARHPTVTFVHVTAPLTTVEGGLRGRLRHWFGGGARGEAENVKRHQFNQLLRERYGGREPVFDLALAETTWEDGRSHGFARNGTTYPALVPAYTDDGGHLNERGRRHVARALAAALAGIGTP